MQATTTWVRAARSAPAVGHVARRMASSSSPGQKGKKRASQLAQDARAAGSGADVGLFDPAKSFPLFKGEGGVIESNKFYIHPLAMVPGKGRPDVAWAKEAMSMKLSSVASAAKPPEAPKGMDALPSAVAEALRVGFVGPRFKQLGMQGTRRPGEGPGPSVIELEGTIYIVEK